MVKVIHKQVVVIKRDGDLIKKPELIELLEWELDGETEVGSVPVAQAQVAEGG